MDRPNSVDVHMHDLMSILSEDDRSSMAGAGEPPSMVSCERIPIAVAHEAISNHVSTRAAAQGRSGSEPTLTDEDGVINLVSSALSMPGGREMVGKILELPPLQAHVNEKQASRILTRRRCKVVLQSLRVLRGYAPGSYVRSCSPRALRMLATRSQSHLYALTSPSFWILRCCGAHRLSTPRARSTPAVGCAVLKAASWALPTRPTMSRKTKQRRARALRRDCCSTQPLKMRRATRTKQRARERPCCVACSRATRRSRSGRQPSMTAATLKVLGMLTHR